MLTPETRLRDFPSLADRAYLNTAAEGIPPPQVAEAPKPAPAVTASAAPAPAPALIAGAQPVVSSNSFESRWGAFR